MLRSLQTRLVLSYAMVIAVCLALVGLASLVLLGGDQHNLVYSHLSDGSVLAAAVTSQVLREGDSRQEAADRMVQQLNRGDVIPTSVYISDREGALVAYSGESGEARTLERFAGQVLGLRASLVRGELPLVATRRLLYAAEPVRVSADGQLSVSRVLIIAEPYRPMRLALGDLLPRLLWSGAIALVVSMGLAALLAYFIARPLDRMRRGGGAGLGLIIARESVEGHGAHLLAESVEGLGTRITMKLPGRRS